MRALIMKTRCLIATILLPLAIAATATTADAQGKGKAKGGEKAGQSQGRGAEKSGKGQVVKASKAAPAPGQMRAADNGRGGGRGRSVAKVKGNAGTKALPASANASPRASVAAAPNRGRAV